MNNVEDLKVKSQIQGYLLNTIFYLITFVPLMLFNAWCFMSIWNLWMPLVFNFQIGIQQAVAVSMVANWFMVKFNSDGETSKHSYWIKVIANCICRLFLVGISYLVYFIIV